MSLKTEGKIIDNEDQITEAIHEHFKNIFGSNTTLRWSGCIQDSLNLKRGRMKPLRDIIRFFSEEESKRQSGGWGQISHQDLMVSQNCSIVTIGTLPNRKLSCCWTVFYMENLQLERLNHAHVVLIP